MGNLFSKKSVDDEVKEALLNNDEALAAAILQEYLDKEENIPLNIAVTGETGSGKSSFVNAIRGLDDDDEGAASTGVVETTMEVTSYPHPNFPNVTLWDLPGIGTTSYPAAEYLNLVGFERFDFFIIISADRFTENDVKLSKEIQRMKKKFYFVRSKIDNNIRDEKRKMNFNEEQTLRKIREYCSQSLWRQGFEFPRVFLVSNKNPPLYDFSELLRTLEGDLPELKRVSKYTGVPYEELKEVIKSPLAAAVITNDLLLRILAGVASLPLLMAAEEVSRFIPILGIPISMGLSFTFTYRALSFFLDVLAEDAKRVLRRALT